MKTLSAIKNLRIFFKEQQKILPMKNERKSYYRKISLLLPQYGIL